MIRDNARLGARIAALPSGCEVVTCTVVRGEVLFGVERLPPGKRRDALRARAIETLSQLPCEPIAPPTADEYARIKNICERSGISLNDNDLWIAATAVSVGAILVSQDQDFRRVPGLSVEDWTQ